MHRLEADAVEPDALGHRQCTIKVEVAQGVAGQAKLEGNRGFRAGRLAFGRRLKAVTW